MKVFWSWQSDTPGKTGRFFVRNALAAAIKRLKQSEEIAEPSERDLRDAMHLDQDRQGVSGTPELARTIQGKIDDAAVFVGDVTLTGSLTFPSEEAASEKRLINSNVGIEYGYAVKSRGDEMILLVQNTHYGDREGLPFDLKHKAGPIQYRLAPNATADQSAAERAKLTGEFVKAIRACIATLAKSAPPAPRFVEIQATDDRARFWQRGEVLATLVQPRLAATVGSDRDILEYTFDEPRVLYLRLIPTRPLIQQLATVKLAQIVEQRRVRVLTGTINGGMPSRNRYGAVSIDTDGAQLAAFTQLLTNGEIWSVSAAFWSPFAGSEVIAMDSARQYISEGIKNFVDVAGTELGIEAPYDIEVGVIGIKGLRLSMPQPRQFYVNQFSEEVYSDEVVVRDLLDDLSPESQSRIVTKFVTGLYDLAGIQYP